MLSSLTGGFGILIGAQTMAMSSQHVEGDPPSWATVVTFASGVWCTLAAIVATEYREVVIRHHSLLYLVAGAISPVWLTSSALGGRTMVMHEGVVGPYGMRVRPQGRTGCSPTWCTPRPRRWG